MRISDWSSDVCSSDLGASSSQRHWHEDEDEMVIMLSGEAILVDNNGRTVMCAGDVAAFPKDDGNGHVVVNESRADCGFVASGRPASGDCHYDRRCVGKGTSGSERLDLCAHRIINKKNLLSAIQTL